MHAYTHTRTHAYYYYMYMYNILPTTSTTTTTTTTNRWGFQSARNGRRAAATAISSVACALNHFTFERVPARRRDRLFFCCDSDRVVLFNYIFFPLIAIVIFLLTRIIYRRIFFFQRQFSRVV